MARAIAAVMASVLFVMFAEAGRAADLSGSYTFKQSDGSEYIVARSTIWSRRNINIDKSPQLHARVYHLERRRWLIGGKARP